MLNVKYKCKMLNLNVTGETKYLANMQIHTACHQK